MTPEDRANMREAVAVAMYVATGAGKPTWKNVAESERDDYRAAADAAIMVVEAWKPTTISVTAMH